MKFAVDYLTKTGCLYRHHEAIESDWENVVKDALDQIPRCYQITGIFLYKKHWIEKDPINKNHHYNFKRAK